MHRSNLVIPRSGNRASNMCCRHFANITPYLKCVCIRDCKDHLVSSKLQTIIARQGYTRKVAQRGQ